MVFSPVFARRAIVAATLAATSLGVCGMVAAQKELDYNEDPVPGTGEPEKPREPPPEDKAAVEAVAAYRQWRLVNPEPHWVPGPLASLCAPFRLWKKGDAHAPHNVHESKWVRVYVNAAGEAAMMTRQVPDFPRGTIIVKEKLPAKDSEKAELLTVMVRREAGYDEAKGDWEYLTMSGDAASVHTRGKLDNCQACHVPQKENGYVFRTYLPEAVKKALK